MRRSLRDAFVGFSLLGGLVIFSGAMLWLRDFRLGSKTWEISASFKDASGLAKMSPVTYRGIIVGSVQKISFTPNTVETKIKLNNDKLILPKPVIAKIVTSSMLGGDAQLSLAQNSKLSGSIIISTPQDVALADARKGINMFKKVNVPVLGLVENMSYFICNNCGERHEIFSSGNVKKEAVKFETPFLGELPIDINLRINSDTGKPICFTSPDGEISKIYLSIAKKIHQNSN